MSQRPKAKRTTVDEEDLAAEGPPVVDLSSSDDEANQDLSLAIVEKASQRESRQRKAEDGVGGGATLCAFIDISTSSDDPDLVPNAATASSKEVKLSGDVAVAPSEEAKTVQVPMVSRKRKPKKKKKKKAIGDVEEKQVDVSITEEEAAGKAESTVTIANVVNKVPESNVVLQKLLRGPRYFDLEESNMQSCFNCCEEGHVAADCPMEKRQKPCYVCGLFGHNSKQCMKEKSCYICKRRGHRAKNCPENSEIISPDSKFCLSCGDVGHEMSSCNNDYPPDDLKEIQCYMCKKFGHLCCLEFIEHGPIEVSCYNCAQSGHNGIGCGKTRGETSHALSPLYCYRCNEEGHFARGCTKSDKPHKWNSEMSTPKKVKEKKRSLGHGSAPHYLHKARKKDSVYEERRNMTTGKLKVKTGPIGDHANFKHRQKHRENMWTPRTNIIRKSQRDNSPHSGWHGSSSWVPRGSQSFVRTPNSHVQRRSYMHDIPPRFGGYHDLY